MSKTRTTRTIRLAWFVRTVKVEQVHNSHVRIVLPDSLAVAPVFAGHARASQYQQARVLLLAQLARATEWQTPAKHSVSVPPDKRERLASPALARHVPPMKFQTLTERTVLFVPLVKPASAATTSVHLVPALTFPMQTLVPVFHVRRVNTRLATHDARHVPPDNSLPTPATHHAHHARRVRLPAARATHHARHAETENTPSITEPIVRLVRTDNSRPRRKTVVRHVRPAQPAQREHARHAKPDNAQLTINPRVKLVRTDNNHPQTE